MKNKWITFDDNERKIAWLGANTLKNRVLPMFLAGVTDRKKIQSVILEFEKISELDFPHMDAKDELVDGISVTQACVVMRISQLSDNLMSVIAKSKSSGLHLAKHVETYAMGARVKEAAEVIKAEIAVLFGLSSQGYFNYETENEEEKIDEKD